MTTAKNLVIGLVCAAIVWQAHLNSAQADPAFQRQFWTKYLDEKTNPEYAELIKKKVKCFLCHDAKKDAEGKTSKKNRNGYGDELAKLLDRKKDRKDLKKIQEALDKVAKLNSDPKDPKSPKFGELIKEGKLPSGSLEEIEAQKTAAAN